MDNNSKFNSVILMLKEEDKGFGKDKEPQGYIRLEKRDKKNKISAMVQDLKDSDENTIYSLYLIGYREEKIYPVLIANIPVKNGKGQVTKEFSSFDFEGTELHINDFSIGVIVLKLKNLDKTVIKYPLASYKNEKLKWKKALDDHLEPVDSNRDVYSKYKGKVESKYPVTENKPEIIQKDPVQKDPVQEEPFVVDLLVSYFDKTFKRCDPFNTKRRDYKWWKIHSPVYFNNVLQYCNISVPKIFNPAVIMAYYKYRYLIAGIYTSRKKDKEYIVYGIPGTYSVDESPLGDLCRWIQIEGNVPKYGTFGYWIVYIDPLTGKLLKVG